MGGGKSKSAFRKSAEKKKDFSHEFRDNKNQ